MNVIGSLDNDSNVDQILIFYDKVKTFWSPTELNVA